MVGRGLGALGACLGGAMALLVATSCSGAGGGQAAKTSTAAFGDGTEADGRIEVKTAGGRPRLTLVRREGDPRTGTSVALVTQAAPRATLVLASVVRTRLEAAGLHIDERIDREAFFVTARLDDADLAGFFAGVQKALSTPITAAEVAAAESALAGSIVQAKEPAELVEVDRCVGKLVPGDAPAAPADVERARQTAFAHGRASFAVVGKETALAAAERALVTSPAWPDGNLEASPPPPAQAAAGRSATLPSGAARVSVALYVADARAAASVADRLGRVDSPLRAKLARLDTPFSIDELAGVARPSGGCISVTMTSASTDSRVAASTAAVDAASLAEGELSAAMTPPVDATVAVKQVLGATDPVEAATIAAWWALSAPSSSAPAPMRAIVAGSLDADAADADLAKLKASLAGVAPARVAPPPLASRTEHGQAELWATLLDPCAPFDEAAHQWGTAALVVTAAALGSPEVDGVTIEPLVDGRGVGVVAHAAPRKGEAPSDLATRVGRAAAIALVGRPVSEARLLEAQSIARTELERAWGKETLGLKELADAVSPDRPAAFEPRGSFAQLSRLDVVRAAHRWRSLGASGWKLAVLANDDDAQGPLVANAVGAWTTTPRAAACATTLAPARPGRADVRPAAAAPGAGAARFFVAMPVEASPMASVARELLDGAGDGSLTRPALSAQPNARARSWVAGDRVLVLTLQTPIEQEDEAGRIATGVVDRLARGEVAEPALRKAAREADEIDEARLSDPRQRLSRLAFGRALTVDRADTSDLLVRFRAFATKSLVEARRVVVSARP